MSVRDRTKNIKENEAVKSRPCPSSPEVVSSPLFLNEENYVFEDASCRTLRGRQSKLGISSRFYTWNKAVPVDDAQRKGCGEE